MQSIEEALKEVCTLHEQVTRSPAPEIGPQVFMPMPAGVDPVAYAIEEVSRLKQIVQQSRTPTTHAPQPSWTPRTSIHGGESNVLFTVDLPGVTKKDVSLSVMGGELILRGHRRPPEAGEGLRPMVVEQPWGAFERRFPVPNWCSTEKISARYNQGVLEINFTRMEGASSNEVRVDIA